MLEAITSPVISTTCTRIPGMRFPDPRVQALLSACCALALRPARLHQPRPAALPRSPAGEDARGYDRRPDQLRPAQAPRPSDHRAHPAQPQLPGHRRRPDHRAVPHPADPAAPDTRPRPAHQPRTTRPQPAPASRPRLPRRPDRPCPAGIPRRLTPPAAITRSNHEPGRPCHQPSHTPQLDSKFKIPAGKDNLPGGGPRWCCCPPRAWTRRRSRRSRSPAKTGCGT